MQLLHHSLPLARPALLTALALALWCASLRADTLEGTLERGPAHSVLWFISPESGDLIGQVFANTSPAGQTILDNCLPGLSCVAEDASMGEADETLLQQLHFAHRPSGWWHIRHAQRAHMQDNLPMQERELRTRFGQLRITDEHFLLLDDRPVLAPAPQAAPSASPAPAAPTSAASPSTLLARLSAWWHTLWSQWQNRLRTLLGRTPLGSAATPELSPPSQPIGTAEAVQGNSALHLAAHLELQDRDIVLLQDTGGSACPALYRFATLTPSGIVVTPEFGTCSGIAALTLLAPSTGGSLPEPQLAMTGYMGPFEPLQERQRAAMRLHRFVLSQGQVQELQP